MLGFGTVTRLLGVRRHPVVDNCVVCSRGVHEDDPRLAVGGRWVHRGCSTYRMRRQVSYRRR